MFIRAGLSELGYWNIRTTLLGYANRIIEISLRGRLSVGRTLPTTDMPRVKRGEPYGPVIFGYSPFFRWFLVAGTVLCLAGAWTTSFAERPFQFLVFLGMTAGCALGSLETWLGFIKVGPEAVTVRLVFSTKQYPRALVKRVSWAKGVPIALELTDGTWANLPDLGHKGSKLVGAIQAWLNRSVPADS